MRLYPVPLRYLETGAQYSLYSWIDAPICKSTADTRPESYKVDAGNIHVAGEIKPDSQGWAARAEFIFKDPSWQFANMRELLDAESANHTSLGIITPGDIDGVSVRIKPETERAEYEKLLREIQSQQHMFLPEYKELGYRPFEIHLRWRCSERCDVCSKKPHNMQVLDWGLMELARKHGWDPEPARLKMEEIAASSARDFKLFLGNMMRHRRNFTVVGLWYPRATDQLRLI